MSEKRKLQIDDNAWMDAFLNYDSDDGMKEYIVISSDEDEEILMPSYKRSRIYISSDDDSEEN